MYTVRLLATQNCGWPFNLLVPRGNEAGMSFRLFVMVTDGTKDQVNYGGPCGSMSYCGSKERYPDARAMGYPFDRPFPNGGSISDTIAAYGNMSIRDITIRWVEP